jgi:metal-sulfur cluster biosynthetic enzyme
MTIGQEQVTEALREVFDPELGMSVVDLGLIYDVRIEDDRIDIIMTLTAEGCPLHDAMSEWVRQAVGTITVDPPWTPDRLTHR